jgi:hypothetical protein
MSLRFIRGILFCFVLGAGRLAADSSPLVLVDPDGRWQERFVGRSFGRGMTFETAVLAPDSRGRLLIFSNRAPIDSPASLREFADQVQTGFSSYHSTKAVERPAEVMGFSGLQYDFELANNEETLACTLFVFAYERRPWGVLSAAPAKPLSAPQPSFALLRKRTSKDPVTLEPYTVKDSPLISYPISFSVTRDRKANHVNEIIVSEVPEGSLTEKAGVKPGDKVIRINGRPAETFTAGVTRTSELGRIFIDRPPGETVQLDLLAPGTRKPFSVTLESESITPHVPKFKLERP